MKEEAPSYDCGIITQMENAFQSIGLSTMTDDFAAKLLAYTFVMGGANSAVTSHPPLYAAIRVAGSKLIKNSIPQWPMMDLFKRYVAELQATTEQTPWLVEITGRYNIKISGRKKL